MGKITFVEGDITEQAVDAIVNAANSSLMGGGGVDGAIHRAGGNRILEECRRIVKEHGPLATGHAVITTGGNLHAQYVIHTVGPIYNERQAESGKQKAELASCYTESLKLAVKHHVKKIAFPSISTGAYRYPLEEAAEIAVKTVRDFLAWNEAIDEVRFVLYDDRTLRAYQNAAD
ncbi:MAG TPA: O-acetyl-ADP-ribose deacetylase [Candidatus Omnitrophota bacterium]|nr:O-acetyl-ADP-ribose deacetylase [Candidatus Omnitrophota bacterium]